MAVIESINYFNLRNEVKNIQLLHPDRANSFNFETTILTGKNGSHKSSLLRQIAAMWELKGDEGRVKEGDKSSFNFPDSPLICVSGSLADRFPTNARAKRRSSKYDHPHYTYFGQRVMSNLLSKKTPLETMLNFALSPKNLDRFQWGFFQKAHAFAGIEPVAKYMLRKQALTNSNTPPLPSLLEGLGLIAYSKETRKNSQPGLPRVSKAMAQWLLNEFLPEDFYQLQEVLSKKRTVEIELSQEGLNCISMEPNVLRLGLLLGTYRVELATVRSVRTGKTFSAFDLSSGEYQMLLTMLALGFSVEKKAVVLIDEPENSLHPQWQRDLMASIFETFIEVGMEGHVIVSTHSPLIVGAAPEGTSVVDLSRDEPLTTLVSYGASSDELLLTQFGIGSSRNKVVVDTVQKAIALLEKGGASSSEFLSLAPMLRLIRDALTLGDPLIEVINALLGEEKENECI